MHGLELIVKVGVNVLTVIMFLTDLAQFKHFLCLKKKAFRNAGWEQRFSDSHIFVVTNDGRIGQLPILLIDSTNLPTSFSQTLSGSQYFEPWPAQIFFAS